MSCHWCNGRGDHGMYDPHDPCWIAPDPDDELDRENDPGVTLCDFCEGTGRVHAALVFARWADRLWTCARRWVRYESVVGEWWWERVGCRRRAERLLCRGTVVEGTDVECVLVRRRARLRTFIEANDPGLRQTIIVERRMVAEAQLALQIRTEQEIMR